MIHVVSLNSCIDRTLTCDGFHPGEVNLTRLIHEMPAGKGVNVARILAALGKPCMLHGFVGTDRLLDFEKLLNAEKVKCRLIGVAGRTRINTTILDGDQETHIREQGDPVPTAAISSLKEELNRKTPVGEWWLFSGSLPPGYPAEELCRCIRTLREAGCKVAIDTSGEALRVIAESGADLIKPNRSELVKLLGVASDENNVVMARMARERLIRGGHCWSVLFSDGEKGTFGIGSDRIEYAHLDYEPKVCSVLGAGDALLAGYLAGLDSGYAPTDCLRQGVAVAVASLSSAWAGDLGQEPVTSGIVIEPVAGDN